MRLIDAEKIPWTDLSDGKGLCWVTFLEKVEKMPTVDAIHVSCIECKHCTGTSNFLTGFWCWEHGFPTPKNGFCWRGERKGGEE